MSHFEQNQTAAPSGAVVLSCFRDYFAGTDVEKIAEKMRRGGMEPEMIRYYTEDIFGQAKAGLTDWQEQMNEQILAIPSGPPA